MRLWLASLAFGIFASVAGAQQAQDPLFEVPLQQLQSAVVVLDVDRLFTQSDFGARVSRDYDAARTELVAEQRRIASALREEELALAAQRVDMDAAVFRAEAEAFDAKAQAIRRAQDTKVRDLEDTLTQGRSQFLEAATPVLEQLMMERRAAVILDRRTVLFSVSGIDITDTAIARINATVGDGQEQAAPSSGDN